MDPQIAIYGIMVAVGVAIFTSLAALWYRSGRSVTHAELDARFNRTDELIANNTNQLRAEMAANRTEVLAEIAKNREEMAAGRAEVLAEIAKNRIEMRQDLRQAVLDLTQAIANHQHDPDGRVSVVMVAEPQSGYETNRPAE